MTGTVWLVALALAASGVQEGVKEAAPTPQHAARTPIEAARLRESSLSLDRYGRELVIVRVRSAGKRLATFVAEPMLLEPGMRMVFEARSEARTGSVVRWRCIASQDVAECLGSPLKIAYLPNDERVVLTARVVPVATTEGLVAAR